MRLWSKCFASVKEIRAGGTHARSATDANRNGSRHAMAGAGGGAAGNGEGEEGDWWDDVSHQAQRVAHVAAASAFAAGGGEVTLFSFSFSVRRS